MLVQRLTTAQVMQHPWFLHKLPKGVDTLNKRCLAMKVRCLAEFYRQRLITQKSIELHCTSCPRAWTPSTSATWP